MNAADDQLTANRLSAIVANSLDMPAKTRDLARQAYRSRTQFHRLFRAIVDETPAAMRRRLLLERAAWQLLQTATAITEIALDANYGSLEAFTRALPPSLPNLAQHLPPRARRTFPPARAQQNPLPRPSPVHQRRK